MLGSFFKKFKRANVLISILALILLAIFAFILIFKNTPSYINYEMYSYLLNNNKIKLVKLDGEELILYTKARKFVIPKDAIDMSELFENVPLDISNNSNSFLLIFIISIVAIFLAFFAINIRKSYKKEIVKQISKISNIQSTYSTYDITSNLTFKDIAGSRDIKSELMEVVDFLKNSQKYKKRGINLPRGVLLIGPPGVGKTLMAKAVAGEAGVPFFYQSGATFVEMYVGIGAKRVKTLFQRAKRKSPSIIFIDEIDAVGKKRGDVGSDERQSTLNQLLTEMDGFESDASVIVLAATNKIDLIDSALLRPGRFDRRVYMQLPDYQDRLQILKMYLAEKSHKVDINYIAKISVFFSGAALSTLVNEAAINAFRRSSKQITNSDFIAVKDNVLVGKKKHIILSNEERKVEATYQSAKIFCAYYFGEEFDKFTILGGGLLMLKREIETKAQLISKIKIHLAGMAATNIIYNQSFTNAKEDLKKAKQIAYSAIYIYGMEDELSFSQKSALSLLNNSFVEVKKFLEDFKPQIKKIADILLEREFIMKNELEVILNGTL